MLGEFNAASQAIIFTLEEENEESSAFLHVLIKLRAGGSVQLHVYRNPHGRANTLTFWVTPRYATSDGWSESLFGGLGVAIELKTFKTHYQRTVMLINSFRITCSKEDNEISVSGEKEWARAEDTISRSCCIWMDDADINLSHSISFSSGRFPMSILQKLIISNTEQRLISKASLFNGCTFIKVHLCYYLCRPNGSMHIPNNRWTHLTLSYMGRKRKDLEHNIGSSDRPWP